MTTLPKIAIVGPGAWGQALAKNSIVNHKATITFFGKPHHKTDLPVRINHTLEDIAHYDGIILATPSTEIPSILETLAKKKVTNPILCASKGLAIYDNTAYLFHELPFVYKKYFSYLSGPTFAKELAKQQYTQAIVSGENASFWQPILASPSLSIIQSTDVIGTALSGVYKNIAACIAGCCQPPNFGENTRALVLVAATQHLAKIIKKCEGNPMSAYNIAGLGDIILSGSSSSSRNFQFGKSLVTQKHSASQTTESKDNIIKISKYLSQKALYCGLIDVAHNIITQPTIAGTLIKTWLDHQIQPGKSC